MAAENRKKGRRSAGCGTVCALGGGMLMSLKVTQNLINSSSLFQNFAINNYGIYFNPHSAIA